MYIILLLALPFVLTYLLELVSHRWFKILPIKNYYLVEKKAGFNYRFYSMLLIFALYGLIDYWNLFGKFYSSSVVGWGIIRDSSNLIYYLTLLAVASYTYETYRLRDETYKMADSVETTRKDEYLPIITFEIKEALKRGGNIQTRPTIRNVGKGIAKQLYVYIEEKIIIGNLNLEAGGVIDREIIKFEPPEISPPEIPITIKYEDIYNRKFVTTARLVKQDDGYRTDRGRWEFSSKD